MKKISFAIVLFIAFYKVTLLSSALYLVFPVTILGLLLLIRDNHLIKGFIADNFHVIGAFLLLFAFTVLIDVVGGGLSSNLMGSFTLRAITLILMSFIPAFVIIHYYVGTDLNKLRNIFIIAIAIQIIFWLITFLSTDIKVAVYSLSGHGDSVNLRPHNLSTRGFGYTSEINFTGPFMTVVVALIFLRKFLFSAAVTLMQLVNSNMTIVAAVGGLILSKIPNYLKVLIVAVGVIAIGIAGSILFPRFYDEFITGGGVRTLMILLENHVVVLNNSMWDKLYGLGVYIFDGNEKVYSDIGWVIMFNFGGWVIVLLFLILLATLSYSIFGFSMLGLAWFGFGLVLNTKGLLFSPNAYMFVSFLLLLYGALTQKKVSL
ncbi:hypothetical protein LG272_11130 [Pseudidiomarina marina]|uniref:hypothetical protein n=1 Tax=Pseudidiomarina marina TaxID=502366 RepID=UPI00384A6324